MQNGGPVVLDTMNAPTKAEKISRIRLSFDMLSALLQLPEDCKIQAIHATTETLNYQVVDIYVQGLGSTIYPGFVIPILIGKVSEYRDDEGRCFKRVISWESESSLVK